ncbi:MAG: dimethylargininase [Pyrinomonadaceae bacterium]|nr:dimethylargininase [Pyrinomonadaceae bacterium]
MLTAITRKPAQSVNDCELSFVERQMVSYEVACEQHDQYERVLERFGCRVVTLPPLEDYPDSVFVEDTAVVLDEVAILCSPGAESRRGEVDSIEKELSEYRETARISPPSFIDGGDVLTVGKTILIGNSGRTNRAGFESFSSIAGRFGYSTENVEVNSVLHLKSAVSALDDETVLLNPAWLDVAHFKDFNILEVCEELAADHLRLGQDLVASSSYPDTLQAVRDAGYKVTEVDISEFEKMEAAVTCMSLVFN